MRYRESEETYLETILLLKRSKKNIRSVDVVEELGYAKSSVSRGINLLRKRGYVTVEPTGDITLTEAGLARAEEIYERHRVIAEALMKMGAEPDSAEENACRIEHVISFDMIEVIKRFINRP